MTAANADQNEIDCQRMPTDASHETAGSAVQNCTRSANQFHLTNVVVNILENALKYSEGPPKIEVHSESTNKYFIFSIKDEGIGMSKSVQKNIFQKFYREERGNIHNVKGHGLGLAYVKEIVEKHHGTVFVESEKGKGSIFTVKLPII